MFPGGDYIVINLLFKKYKIRLFFNNYLHNVCVKFEVLSRIYIIFYPINELKINYTDRVSLMDDPIREITRTPEIRYQPFV